MVDEMLLPDSAGPELQRAFDSLIETGAAFLREGRSIPGVDPSQVVLFYRRALDWYALQTPKSCLAAERWARAVKHLTLAFWHEARLDYLTTLSPEVPRLPPPASEARLRAESRETARALIESAALKIPLSGSPESSLLLEFLARGRGHLATLAGRSSNSELLEGERILAAHEYGRVLEYALLALEAEQEPSSPVAA